VDDRASAQHLLRHAHQHTDLESRPPYCCASRGLCTFERGKRFLSQNQPSVRVGYMFQESDSVEQITKQRSEKNVRSRPVFHRVRIELTSFNRLMVPERITVPVSRQMAVSDPPSSSVSSVRLSRPFTRLTMLYNSTNEVGSLIKQLGG